MTANSRPTITRRHLVLVTVVAAIALAVLIPAASGAGATGPAAQIKNCKRRHTGKGKKKHRAEVRCEKKVREAAALRRAAEHNSPPPASAPPPAPSGSSGSSPGDGAPPGSSPSGPSAPVEEPAPPAPPPAAPDTIIDTRPPATVAPTATEAVTFHATGSGSRFECRVGSGGFEPCNSPWSFEVGDPGGYTGQVRAVGEGGADPTPASFDFRSAPPIERCGTLDHDETWSTQEISGVVLTCKLEVPTGVKLTIGPGVFVKSGGGALGVLGTLHADGTPAEPVTFTSIDDDSVGGDTGEDGPQAGDWAGLAASDQGSMELRHVRIGYAATAVTAEARGSATVADDSITDAHTGVLARDPDSIAVTDSTVEAEQEPVVILAPGSPATVSGDTLTSAHDVRGLLVHQGQDGAFGAEIEPVAVAHNTVSVAGTGDDAEVEVDSKALDFAELATNVLSGPDSSRRIDVGGTVTSSQTWSPALFGWSIEQDPVNVAAGVTLTLAPGLTVKSSQTLCDWDLGNCEEEGGIHAALGVLGTLHADGTPAEPVTFTSIDDDSVGGDTGEDGPQAGDWAGLAASDQGSMELRHVRIGYAATAVTAEARGSATVADDSITDAHTGLLARDPDSIAVTDSTVEAEQEPVVILAPGSPTTVSGDTLTSAHDVRGLLVHQGQDGAFGAEIEPVAVAHNTVSVAGTGDDAEVEVDSKALDFAELATNVLSGPDSSRRIDVGGTVTSSQTWSPALFGWSIEQDPVNVAAGVTLTLAPGLTVKSSQTLCDWDLGNCEEEGGIHAALGVLGTLHADGTPAEPVTFTSIDDDSVGGDTGEDGPQAGDWAGIAIDGSGALELDHARVAYGSRGVVATTDSKVLIEHDVFTTNEIAIAIVATPGTNAAIHHDWFDGNGIALDGSSAWIPTETGLTSCRFLPSMAASDNEYGSSRAAGPFLSQAELTAIEVALLEPGAETSPEGWTSHVEAGGGDHIFWSELPCQPTGDDPPHPVFATPFDIGG